MVGRDACTSDRHNEFCRHLKQHLQDGKERYRERKTSQATRQKGPRLALEEVISATETYRKWLDERERTLMGSDRVMMVTSGIYRMATPEPATHILKYGLLNQSFCFGRALTTNSQKHNSIVGVSDEKELKGKEHALPSRCVTLEQDAWHNAE
jgi:hypothetical protein